MYLAARGLLGLSPSEFWAMTPAEFWLEYEARRPHDAATDYAGGLTAADIEDLLAWDGT